MSKILTIKGQKHTYESFISFFQALTEEEKKEILDILKLESTTKDVIDNLTKPLYKITTSIDIANSIEINKVRQVLPSYVNVKVLKVTLLSTEETNEMVLTSRYIYRSNADTSERGEVFNRANSFVFNYSNEPIAVEFKLYDLENNLLDTKRVSILKDGVDGTNGRDGVNGESGSNLMMNLTNDNSSVPADKDGVLLTAIPSTTAEVYFNSEKQNDWVFSGVFHSSEGTVGERTGLVQVTNLTADSGYVDISARKNSRTLTKRYTINKVKSGQDGVNPIIYYIEPSVPIVKIEKTGTRVPSTVSCKRYKHQYPNPPVETTEYQIKYSIDKGPEQVYTGPVNVLSANEIIFYLYDGSTLLDTEVVPFIKDGLDGIDGTPGTPGTPGTGANYVEFRYAKNGSYSTPPALVITNPNPPGWSTTPPELGNDILWMTVATKSPNGSLINNWSTPIRISGPSGPPGPPGRDGINGGTTDIEIPFIAPMGLWKDNVQYKGSTKRIEAVKYGDSWYVSRTDAGNIPIGTLPTDTRYWNKSDVNYDIIATDLFLASSAYIHNLMVRNLKTADSGQRVEITGQDNSIKFYAGNEDANKPTIKIDANVEHINDYNDGRMRETAVTKTVNKASIKLDSGIDNFGDTVEISTAGIYSNARNVKFTEAFEGMDFEGSIVGVNYGKYHRNKNTVFLNTGNYRTTKVPRNYDTFAGVVGYLPFPDLYYTTIKEEGIDDTGTNFGGYFNTILCGAKYSSTIFINDESINAVSNRGTPEISLGLYVSRVIIETNRDFILKLPRLRKVEYGWREQTSYEIEIIKKSSAGTVMITNNTVSQMRTSHSDMTETGDSYVAGMIGSIQKISHTVLSEGDTPKHSGRFYYKFIWDGTHWINIKQTF